MNLNFSRNGLGTGPFQRGGREDFGLRWQSAATTPLFGCGKPFQSGVALRFPPHSKKPGQAAFTMIEIAIALAVIAFALVAIIGVLPTGLNVQKDNREETIINQDGPFWLEAIRNGAQGLDYLTNYVASITLRTIWVW